MRRNGGRRSLEASDAASVATTGIASVDQAAVDLLRSLQEIGNGESDDEGFLRPSDQFAQEVAVSGAAASSGAGLAIVRSQPGGFGQGDARTGRPLQSSSSMPSLTRAVDADGQGRGERLRSVGHSVVCQDLREHDEHRAELSSTQDSIPTLRVSARSCEAPDNQHFDSKSSNDMIESHASPAKSSAIAGGCFAERYDSSERHAERYDFCFAERPKRQVTWASPSREVLEERDVEGQRWRSCELKELQARADKRELELEELRVYLSRARLERDQCQAELAQARCDRDRYRMELELSRKQSCAAAAAENQLPLVLDICAKQEAMMEQLRAELRAAWEKIAEQVTAMEKASAENEKSSAKVLDRHFHSSLTNLRDTMRETLSAHSTMRDTMRDTWRDTMRETKLHIPWALEGGRDTWDDWPQHRRQRRNRFRQLKFDDSPKANQTIEIPSVHLM